MEKKLKYWLCINQTISGLVVFGAGILITVAVLLTREQWVNMHIRASGALAMGIAVLAALSLANIMINAGCAEIQVGLSEETKKTCQNHMELVVAALGGTLFVAAMACRFCRSWTPVIMALSFALIAFSVLLLIEIGTIITIMLYISKIKHNLSEGDGNRVYGNAD